MEHVVLKPFGWYPDGFTRETLDVGDERDFGANAGAMKAAGMIGDVATQKVVHAAPQVEAVVAPATLESAPVATPDAEELASAEVATEATDAERDKPRRKRK